MRQVEALIQQSGIETEKVPVVMLETLVKIQKALDVDFEVKHLDWQDAVTEKINQQRRH